MQRHLTDVRAYRPLNICSYYKNPPLPQMNRIVSSPSILRRLLLLVSFLAVGHIYAQLSESSNRHFIVAVDGATPYTNVTTQDWVRDYVTRTIRSLGGQRGDRLTLMTYQIDFSNPDFSNFARVIHSNGGGIGLIISKI